MEESDCLLAVGFRRTDASSGFFSDALPADTIHLRGFSADVGPDNFQGITLQEILRAVTNELPSSAAPVSTPAPAPKAPASPDNTGKLTQTAFWQMVQGFLREGDVLIAEDGTSSAGAGALALPPGCNFITQTIWGSIGYSLGALLGTLIAEPERRHLLFIGDGSFSSRLRNSPPCCGAG